MVPLRCSCFMLWAISSLTDTLLHVLGFTLVCLLFPLVRAGVRSHWARELWSAKAGDGSAIFSTNDGSVGLTVGLLSHLGLLQLGTCVLAWLGCCWTQFGLVGIASVHRGDLILQQTSDSTRETLIGVCLVFSVDFGLCLLDQLLWFAIFQFKLLFSFTIPDLLLDYSFSSFALLNCTGAVFDLTVVPAGACSSLSPAPILFWC